MDSVVALILAMMTWAPHVKHTHRCVHSQRARTLAPLIERSAKATGLTVVVIAAVAITESGGQLDRVSPKGAVGPMQILPEGRASLLCRDLDIHKARGNVACGARLLVDARDRCGSEPDVWLSAYNNYPCVPTDYSRRILATAERANLYKEQSR